MARGCSRFTTGLAGAVESTVNAKEDEKVRKHEVLELMHVSEDVYRKKHWSIRNIAGIKLRQTRRDDHKSQAIQLADSANVPDMPQNQGDSCL